MMLQIKRWLAPPVFPDDEPKTRRAILLNFALLTCIILALCLIAGNLAGGKVPALVTGLDIGGVAVCLVLRRWANQGRVGLASGALLAVGLVGITMDVVILGTIRTPSTAVYMLLVVFAGLMFDLGGMIAMTVLCSLAIAGLIVAENTGLLPRPDYAVTISQWVTYSVLFVWVGSLTLSSLQSTRRALARAEKEINERKHAEQTLRSNEERLMQIVETVPSGIAFVDRAGKITFANRAAEKVLGLTRTGITERVYNDPAWKITAVDGGAFPDEQLPFMHVMQTNEPVHGIEHAIEHPDGTRSILSINAAPLCDANGDLIGMVSALTDITERKRAEETLRESEVRYRELFETINSGVAVYEVIGNGQDFIFKEFNRAGEKIDHDRRERLIGKSIFEVRPGVVQFGLIDVFRKVWQTGEKAYYPVTQYQDERLTGWYENYIYKLPSGEIVAVFENITERKQAEDALRESEGIFNQFMAASPVLVYIKDEKHRFHKLSKSFEDLLGKPISELIGKDLYDLLPPELAKTVLEDDKKVLKEGSNVSAEEKLGDRYFSSIKFLIHRESGKPDYLGGFSVDITDRKQAEEILRESEERFRSLFENMLNGFAYCRMLFNQERPQDFIYLKVNRAFEALTGLSGVVGKKVSEVIPNIRESDPELLERYGRVALTGVSESFEIFMESLNMWFSVSVYSPRKEYFVSVFDVITERKGAEAALRESEERYKNLFQNNHAVMLVIDPESGVIVDTNPAASTFYGWNREELLNKNIDEINTLAPEEVQAEMQLARTEKRNHFFFKHRRADGSIRDVDVYSGPLALTGKTLLYSIVHDITERKQAEEAVAQSAEQLRTLTTYWQNAIEAERAYIAREIHDEFGQSMTALKMDLTWLTRRLPEGDERVERIHGMNTLVDDSISLMRRIASSLRPGMLDDLGLNAALEWMTAGFSKRTGIICELSLPPDGLNLDPALNTTLFRIFQETLTNISRHAQATQVEASLRQEGQVVILTVRDNGRGITERELKDPRALGLLGLRERAVQWGGEITIDGEAGKGTTVTTRIPLPVLPAKGGQP